MARSAKRGLASGDQLIKSLPSACFSLIFILLNVCACLQGDPVGTIHEQTSSPTLTYAKQLSNDPIFSELISSKENASLSPTNQVSQSFLTTLEDFQRGKRGFVQLGQIMKCATGCDPLAYKGYGCYCGFGGEGHPVDGIDKCCKMHDWCYTTTTCMDLQYHLPYFVGFKWKCNGGAPYCIPGKTADTDRYSCSHQLCECDRQFAMCLTKHACPYERPLCPHSKARLLQNVFMRMTHAGHRHDHGRSYGGHRGRHRHQKYSPY